LYFLLLFEQFLLFFFHLVHLCHNLA